MPCYDSRDHQPQIVYKEGMDPAYKEEVEWLRGRCKELFDRTNELATLLCNAGRACKNGTDIPEPVLQWWVQHCKLDESRGEKW